MECRHADYHCSKVSYPWPYVVGSLRKPIRWSTPQDPPFPCLCRCGPCSDWRATKAELDGPIMLPTE